MAEVARLEAVPDVAKLPYNIEAEAALLGALMIDNRLVERVADKLTPEHFFEPLHARIFTAILRETGQNKIANPVTLKPYFDADPAMKELGGVGYLAQLTGSGAAVIGAHDFATQIIALAQLRALVAAGQKIIENAADTADDVDFAAKLAFAENALAEVGRDAEDGVIEVSVLEAADRALKAAENPETARIRCGIDPIDAALGPLAARDFTIVAGRPGMGKSVLASNYGRGAAQRKHGVVLFSLEMSAEQLGARVLADMSFSFDGRGVPLEVVLSNEKSRNTVRRIMEVRDELEGLPLQIVDVPGCSIAKLNTMIRRWKRRFAAKGVKLELVIVDYLQLIDEPGRSQNRTEEITKISRGLKKCAKLNDVHVMALSQLSRAVELREDKRPRLSDLRESGSIEQDADNVLFLFRPEYYLRESEPPLDDEKREKWQELLDACKNKLELLCAKRRMGQPGKAFGEFHGSFQAIREARYG